MSTTFERLQSSIDVLHKLVKIGIEDELPDLNTLPKTGEILAAREALLPAVITNSGGKMKWRNTTMVADQDRLLQAVYDLLTFIEVTKSTNCSTGAQRGYLTKTDFERDARLMLTGFDAYGVKVPAREEINRGFAMYKNSGQVCSILAVGRFRDTGNTAVIATYGQTSEYHNGMVSGGEVWQQLLNDTWLKGGISSHTIYTIMSNYQSPSRQEVKQSAIPSIHRGSDVQDDNSELLPTQSHLPYHHLITQSMQELVALQHAEYICVPLEGFGIALSPNFVMRSRAKREAFLLVDIRLITLQTRLWQAINNVMGEATLETEMLWFLVPSSTSVEIHQQANRDFIKSITSCGLPDNNPTNKFLHKTDLHISQALSKLMLGSWPPTAALVLNVSQDISNAVHYTVEQTLGGMMNQPEDIKTDKIVLLLLAIDRLVAQHVIKGIVAKFPLSKYECVQEFVEEKQNLFNDNIILVAAHKYAAGQREAFFHTVIMGIFKNVPLSGPSFEHDEAHKLWQGFLQRLGFRLATIDTGNFKVELGDDFCIEFLNNHSYVDYVTWGVQDNSSTT